MPNFRKGCRVRAKKSSLNKDWLADWFKSTGNKPSDIAVVARGYEGYLVLDYPKYKGVNMPPEDFELVRNNTIIIVEE